MAEVFNENPKSGVRAAGEMLTHVTVGGVAGSLLANEFIPAALYPNTEFAYTAQATLNKGAEVDLGTIALHVPNALGSLPAGVRGNITELTLSLTGRHATFETLSALSSHFSSEITHPTATAILERAGQGGAAGAILGCWLGPKIVRAFREKGPVQRFREMTGRKKTMAAVGCLVLSGCGATTYNNVVLSAPTPEKAYLPATLTQGHSALKGAYITGVDPTLVQDFVQSYVKYKQGVDHFWNVTAPKSLDQTYHTKKVLSMFKPYMGNTNLLRIWQVGDFHCDTPAITYVQKAVEESDPNIIVDGGDIFTNSDTMPYEKNCLTDYVNAIGGAARKLKHPITVVRVNAEHDPKTTVNINRPYVKVYTLRGANNTLTVDGATFVGDDDPRHVVWSTVPSDEQVTNKALALQSSHIASTACRITEQTGEAPFVLAASLPGVDEALIKGCAKIAFTAHTHQNSGVSVYFGQDGLKEYQHTVGTITGVNEGITIYQQPSQDATFTQWFVKKNTHEPVAAFTTTLGTDGSVSVQKQSLNSQPQEPKKSMYKIESYSPTRNQIPKYFF